MRRSLAILVTAWCVVAACACGGKREQPAPRERTEPIARTPVESPRLAVARAEAERTFGVDTLRELARGGAPAQRRAAIVGLGRVGSRTAIEIARARLADPDGEVRAAALAALWIAGDREAAAAIAELYRASSDSSQRALALQTLGHLGGVEQLALVAEAVTSGDDGTRAAAALALGLYGRRTLPLSEGAVASLVAAAGADSAELRFGVAYALARQHAPAPHDGARRALEVLARDSEPEVRAVAVAGLARRAPAATALFEPALADADWRVRVEAVRALTVDGAPASSHAALARWLVAEWRALRADAVRGVSADVHPMLEALARLRPHARERAVRAALTELRSASAPIDGAPPARQRTVDAVACLTAAALTGTDDVLACGEASGAGWPRHLRRMLAAEVARADQLATLLGDDDPRVRAAALTRAFGLEPVPKPALEAIGDAIASPHAVEVGALFDGVARRAREHGDAELVVLVAGRVGTELAALSAEVEVIVSGFDALAAMGVEKWAKTCRMALAHPNRTVRERASACVSDLVGRDVPAKPPASVPVKPPVDPSEVLGQQVRWRLRTSKGAAVIELEPDAAPWHVATLVALAREGFYDGRSWHRVVPGFVVQGGDPTDSGWGGPGYLIPGEASAPARFDRGVVGIADAGHDTGGSQIFVMHARAPHLEGRYTRVGRVVEGMDVVDALIVGDVIEQTSVEVSPR